MTRTDPHPWTLLVVGLIGLGGILFASTADQSDRAPLPAFTLTAGDHVLFVGNTFAERMALHGYFETFLHSAFPDAELTIRNLGWSGDEVDLRPRPRNTGSFEDHLEWYEADVLFLFYGMNESFAGPEGLEAWPGRLDTFLAGLQAKRFNGESSPRLVLVSPIAHEDLGAPLPTGEAIRKRNADLESYTRVMKEVAAARRVYFVDLFHPTLEWMIRADTEQLTINGIHLNELGDWAVSRMMARALLLLEITPADAGAIERAEKLRRMVFEKNSRFTLFYRPLNTYYIWGGRAWCWEEDEPIAEQERIGVAVRNWEKLIRASERPPPAAVWGRRPSGREIWETPPRITRAEAGPPAPPRMRAARRNGALKKGE